MSILEQEKKRQIAESKQIFKEISKEYKLTFPLEFKNLTGKPWNGYCVYRYIVGLSKYKTITKIILDNTGRGSFELGYTLCHELAHAILKQNHTKAHSKLTYKLAKKYNYV